MFHRFFAPNLLAQRGGGSHSNSVPSMPAPAPTARQPLSTGLCLKGMFWGEGCLGPKILCTHQWPDHIFPSTVFAFSHCGRFGLGGGGGSMPKLSTGLPASPLFPSGPLHQQGVGAQVEGGKLALHAS